MMVYGCFSALHRLKVNKEKATAPSQGAGATGLAPAGASSSGMSPGNSLGVEVNEDSRMDAI
jgi:hypothetical protein